MTKQTPTALITGAGSGIGRALAVEAARRGYHLILVGRRRAQLEETADLTGPAEARIVSADITTPEGRATIAEAAGDRLDIVVNNAGSLCVGRLTDLDDEALSRTINTNLTAALLLTRDLVPALAAAQGRIVNIGSMFGMIAFPYFAAYSATKFATRGLSDALRRELSEFGISVTYVAPRATRTPAQSRFAHLVEPFGMALDDPERVARRAWAGIAAGKATVYPGLGERVFALVQAVVPSLIDTALIHKAHTPRTQAALKTFNEQKEA
ncbi:SDR family NAD(P)-dependent oxidoreductase [Roseovarius sp. A21]|uniref:SDR family NAD(P)-dependent oxidoreductase n=1 Tax=Roseovarius bejariae TaxID=2576383 RepID=A0A844CJA2_9RHOB|nr:SDR family NAD(P)-dependent oxidoreductase [Roseovarius bejariae]MRU14752.1 SDR family NAD(P)-dependent oxidoreductase [Roseovarius bejariae]